MYVCMYTQDPSLYATCMYVCIHVYATCMYVYTYTQDPSLYATCMYVYMYMLHVCMYILRCMLHVWMYVYMYMLHVCMYVYMYMLHVCMYVYTRPFVVRHPRCVSLKLLTTPCMYARTSLYMCAGAGHRQAWASCACRVPGRCLVMLQTKNHATGWRRRAWARACHDEDADLAAASALLAAATSGNQKKVPLRFVHTWPCIIHMFT